MDDGVIVRGVAMVASCNLCLWVVGVGATRERESVRVRVRGPIIDGWAVRGQCKTWTDHFAPLVHAPKKTISETRGSYDLHLKQPFSQYKYLIL
jgi:hypothetical protein